MQEYYSISPFWLSEFGKLFSILQTFNRGNELSRLIQWAERKQLEKPLRLYQNRFGDEERRLFCYTVSSPRLTSLARFLYQFNRLISPSPRYAPVGSARIYRTGLLTKPEKSHSMLIN